MLEVGSLVTAFAKGVFTQENISAAVEFLKGRMNGLSRKAQDAVKQAEEMVKQAEETGKSEGLPEEVLEELKGSLNKAMLEYAAPVYAFCVTFYCVSPLSEKERDLIRYAMAGDGEWEDEKAKEKQEYIDEFIKAYMGGIWEGEGEEYGFEDMGFYLNFDEDSEKRFLYCEQDMRDLADALNYLLGDRCIISYNLYGGI